MRLLPVRARDVLGMILVGWLVASGAARAEESEPCATGATLATGAPDPSIFAREASQGVRAFWCETYDTDGNALRAGAYWEVYPGGATRTQARYVDSRIEGPVEVFDEEGGLWLRGDLAGGEWTGTLELFHPNGATWLTARFLGGRLEGPVETRFPDGRVESSTHFHEGHEDGIATSYYPTAAGGGLRSQVRVEVDEIVENGPRTAPASASGAAGETAETAEAAESAEPEAAPADATEVDRDATAHVSAALSVD